jgi:hypothetical protein
MAGLSEMLWKEREKGFWRCIRLGKLGAAMLRPYTTAVAIER